MQYFSFSILTYMRDYVKQLPSKSMTYFNTAQFLNPVVNAVYTDT